MAKRNQPTLIDIILAADPVDAMEAAKKLVARDDPADVATLMEIAKQKSFALWSRIAAIWTLGFIDHEAISAPVLHDLAHDSTEDAQIKEHALEAFEEIADD